MRVDVVDVESDGFGDARAGRVQQFEQRAVAQRQRAVGRAVAARAVQQREHLVEAQAFGQPPARRRWLDGLRDVEFGQALGGGEPVQTAHRDQRPGRRHRRQRRDAGVRIAAPQRHQELADVVLADLGQVVDAAGRQVLEVAAQVAAIGAQRVGGDAALDGQVIEVTLQLAPPAAAPGSSPRRPCRARERRRLVDPRCVHRPRLGDAGR